MRASSPLVAAALAGAVLASAPAGAAEPIKIGCSMAMTGGVAGIGKQILIALQDLARPGQQEWRPPGPSGRARLL